MVTNYNKKPLLPVWASIPVYLILSILLMGIGSALLSPLYNTLNSAYSNLILQLATFVISSLAVTFAAIFFLKYIDRTSAFELGLDIRGRGKDIAAGFLLAIVIYAIGFGISFGAGVIQIGGANTNATALVITFLLFLFVSVSEEVMVRGYIQGRLMTKLNRFVALGISSIIFAVLHMANPNINLLSFINIFLAGVMLGASFLYTRNLWFPIALHLAWNWIQGPILGYEVSGTKQFPSVLQLILPEENIINGGSFGFEGSIICTFVTITSSVIIIVWGDFYRKRNITTSIE